MVVAVPGASRAPPKATQTGAGLETGLPYEEKGGLAREGAQHGVSHWFALERLRPVLSHLATGFCLSSQQRCRG